MIGYALVILSLLAVEVAILRALVRYIEGKR